jgi:ethanolamine utilization protein EutQ
MADFFSKSEQVYTPYEGFENAYPDGEARIARLISPSISKTLGGGIVRYRRVKTVWRLPFDEIVYVIDGEMVVTASGKSWSAKAGDVLFFPQGEPVGYDVEADVTVFYAKYPGSAST